MNVRRGDISHQEKPRLEERLIAHRLQQVLKFHSGKLPKMASCRNIADFSSAGSERA
jgi:hypothetical protein